MDSEPKKPEVNRNESNKTESEEEDRWIDELAKKIIGYDSCQIREKEILKFLMNWLHVTIVNKEGKRNVSKLLEAISTLRYHYEAMKKLMMKAELFDEDSKVYANYLMSRGNIEVSIDSDDNDDDDDDDDDDYMEVDIEVRKSEGGKA
jgi:hypothetical protein